MVAETPTLRLLNMSMEGHRIFRWPSVLFCLRKGMDGKIVTETMKMCIRDRYYPFCTEDTFVEVSDEIVEAFLLDKRAEAARERKMYRYKAFYSCNVKRVFRALRIRRSEGDAVRY